MIDLYVQGGIDTQVLGLGWRFSLSFWLLGLGVGSWGWVWFSWSVYRLRHFDRPHLESFKPISDFVVTFSDLRSRWCHFPLGCGARNWRSLFYHVWAHSVRVLNYLFASFGDFWCALFFVPKEKFVYFFQVRPFVRITLHHFGDKLLKVSIRLKGIWMLIDLVELLKDFSEAVDIGVESISFGFEVKWIDIMVLVNLFINLAFWLIF